MVLLDVEHPHREAAARLLEAVGGDRCLAAGEVVYGFPTRPARDTAMERVRRAFGWTVAEPRDGLPWLTGPAPAVGRGEAPARRATA